MDRDPLERYLLAIGEGKLKARGDDCRKVLLEVPQPAALICLVRRRDQEIDCDCPSL